MMKDILSYLEEREQEFKRHFSVARMLETRVDETFVDNDIYVEVRHINTVKSGLLVHLYNIVEAVCTRTLTQVGQIVAAERPSLWTDIVLAEWVRSKFWSSEERLGDKALERLTNLSSQLVSGEKTDAFTIKGAPGSWHDEAIKKVAQRLGCQLKIPQKIKRAAYETKYRNEKTALAHLAKRRNDLAHGSSTFEEGAQDFTLDDIEELAERVIPYLKAVTESYEVFLEKKDFLKKEEKAA